MMENCYINGKANLAKNIKQLFTLQIQNTIMEDKKPQKIPKNFKIIAFSDTHNMHDQIEPNQLPSADLMIHCGDFTMDSSPQELASFRQFISSLSYKHKIVIAGNHDFIFHPHSPKNNFSLPEVDKEREELKKLCYFLECDMVNVEGVNILGISKGPEFFDWKFSFAKAEGEALIEQFRDKVDILVTHWPPFGILDQVNKKEKGGSKGLLEFVKAIKPKIHIFGHIHQRRGNCKQYGIEFYNASNATKEYDFIPDHTQIIYFKPK